MKKTLILVLGILSIHWAEAQINAVTETGDAVMLFVDGTWEYLDAKSVEVREIPINPDPFTKDEKSSFLLKSKVVDMGFWLDPKKWTFRKATDNPEAEYELGFEDGGLYGMIITEKIEIPIETLQSIALEAAKSVAPDAKIIKEEYRTVNGQKVLLMQMDGTLQGIKFSYYGYYFSNSSGTVQFITYTSQNLLDSYKLDCEKLLNGLTAFE